MRLFKFILVIVLLGGSVAFIIMLDQMNSGEETKGRLIYIPGLSQKCDSQEEIVEIVDPDDSSRTIPYALPGEDCREGYPLWAVFLVTFITGVIIGYVLAVPQILTYMRNARVVQNRHKKLQTELDSLRNQSITEEIAIRDTNESIEL